MARIREINEAEYALEVSSLSYSFKKHQVLDQVSFKVRTGAIHGFVGPNGAGKTTTLKIVSTLLTPKKERVRVFGMDVVRQQKKVRRYIGFMPDNFAMYRPMRVFEYLDFFAAAYGQSMEKRDQTIHDVLELTDMTSRRNHLIKALSRGMQQRVCLARVLVHDPELLLLDEPASGLDPRARIELVEILKELSNMGKTIFISSHILSELATLCQDVTIIDCGEVKYTGSMSELLATATGGKCEYLLLLGNELVDAQRFMESVPGVESATRENNAAVPTWRILFSSSEPDTSQLLQKVIAAGARIVGFQEVHRQLDDAFMDLTEPGIRS